ncbi:MAG: HpcH/HpaI aldolase/citrate lyase family protein, partial [Endozoicomonas sp.]
MLARSYMFVPGDSDKKLGKAQSLAADALILCLEDAVSEQNKPLAREKVSTYLQKHRDSSKSQLWVRVNPITTEHMLNDLVTVMSGKPFGIFLPKPGSARDFETVDNYLTALEAQHGFEIGSTKIMSVAESAIGTINQGGFANASKRLSGLTWGAEDMSADLGAITNMDDDGVHFLVHKMNRANCLVVTAAGNMQAVDGICADFRNEDKLRTECLRSRQEGFTGKIAIHPSQVAIINECFTPSDEEMAYANRIIEAFENAQGAGTVALDGKMLDLPHLKQARRILE